MISTNILKESNIFSGLAVLLLAAFTITTFGFASDAHAQKINVEFDSIHVQQDRDRLTVHYSIKKNDWRKIQRNDITPTLEVYASRNHRRGHAKTLATQRLHNRTGTLVIRNARLDRENDVFVELHGQRGRAHINRIEYGRQRGDVLQVAVARPAYRPAPPRHNTRPAPVGPPRTTVHETRTVVVHKPAPAPAPKRGITISLGF